MLGLPPDGHALVYMAFSLGLMIVAFVLWVRRNGRVHLIEDLPTTDVAGVVPGLNEVVGRAAAATPTTAPISGLPCVYWEHQRYRKDGRNRKKSVGKKRTGGSGVFWLTDSSGSIRVFPTQADVVAEKVYDGVEPAWDGDASIVGRRMGAADTIHIVEQIVPEDAELYVLGPARPAQDSVELQIGRDRDGSDPLLISIESEERLLGRLKLFSRFMLAGSFVSTLTFAALWNQGERIMPLFRSPKSSALIDPANAPTPIEGIGDIELLPLVMAGWFWGLAVIGVSAVQRYNGLMLLRERAERAWSLIDVQLRRRHDLLPELERVMHASAAQERTVQTALADLRSAAAQAMPTDLGDSSVTAVDLLVARELTSFVQIFGVAERHPTLGSDMNFRHLRDQIVDTENRINRARHFYNMSVNALHDRAQTYPSAWIAWFFELDLEKQFALDKAPARTAASRPNPPSPGGQASGTQPRPA